MGEIKVEPKKLYVAFKAKSNLCDVVIHKQWLTVYFNVKQGLLSDPQKIATMIKDLGHWGNGDYRTKVDNVEQFDYLMTLIRQAYKLNV